MFTKLIQMKKIFLLLAFASTSFYGFSQITITNADMPNTGDTIRYSTTIDINDYTLTDTAYNWDFSTLTPTGQGINAYKSAISINPAYVLSFGFFAYGVKLADSLGAGPIMFRNIYNFYKKTSSKYTIEGYGAELTGIPIPSTYSDPDEVYQFPLSYGRKDTSTFKVTISVPTIVDINISGTRYNEVDGWGTITTPYGTFNVIRLKSTVDEIDSISSSLISTPFVIPRNTTTYQWLCNGEKIPILEAQGTVTGGTFIPTQIRYRDIYRYIAPLIVPTVDFTADKTVCNLLDTVYITNNTAPDFGTSTYRWTVTPATHSFVNGTSASSTNPDLKFSAYGLYAVKCNAEIAGIMGAAPGRDSLLKADYILVRDNTGIENISAAQIFKVFPNPTSQELNLDINLATADMLSLKIYNTEGRLVKQINGAVHSINVADLAAGTYTLELIDKSKQNHYSTFQKK